MAVGKKAPAELYDVRSALTGYQTVQGVSLELAQSECARLNAEARRPNPERPTHQYPQGEPWGMHCGEVTRYEVVSQSGLVVGS